MIDTTLNDVTYQVTQAATIIASQVTIKPADPVINRQTTYDFSLIFPMPLPVGVTI